MASKGFAWEESELGHVYYPKETLIFEEDAEVNYVEYPWITRFGVKGIKIAKKVQDEYSRVVGSITTQSI